MGEKALVESQLSESSALIRQLDAQGDSPCFAVWYFYSDADEWRFLLAGPSFDTLLPKQETLGYRKVAEAMSAAHLSTLSISEIKLVATQSPLPKSLGHLVRTDRLGISQAHFSNVTLNGTFMKAMVILRSAPP